MTREWTVRLPWTKPPLSLNDRSHWRKRAADTAVVREESGYHIHRQFNLRERAAYERGTILCHRVKATLTYYPRDKRRRDATNLVATYKAVIDGMVDAGVILDDTPEYLVEVMPVIAKPDGDPRLILTIEEMP